MFDMFISKKFKIRWKLFTLKKEKYCRIYSLGNYTIIVWSNGGDFRPNYLSVLSYYHPDKLFENFTIEQHGWSTGKWIYSDSVIKFSSNDFKNSDSVHIDKFLELIDKIKKK